MEMHDWWMTPEKVKEFESFMAKAIEGDADAQHSVGIKYDEGYGVAKDQVQAAMWWRKAAEQGHVWAQNNLGVCYLYGQGVVENKIEAYAYMQLAGMEWSEETNDIRWNAARLRAELSIDEIAAGEERTRELQKEIEAKIAAKKAGK